MTTLQESAMRKALEALELHGQQYPHMVKGYCLDAIDSLRTALAQQGEQPVVWRDVIKVLADVYATKVSEFARSLALAREDDSMSPVSAAAGDARMALHEAIDTQAERIAELEAQNKLLSGIQENTEEENRTLRAQLEQIATTEPVALAVGKLAAPKPAQDFQEWWNSLPCEPSYQEAFAAGKAAAPTPQPAQADFESLICEYWDLAYAEGQTGKSLGNEANEVLCKLRALQSAQPVAPLTIDDFEEWHKANFTQSLDRRGYTYSDASVRNRWIGWQAAHGKAQTPLTDDAIWFLWASENGMEDCNMCKQDDFLKVFRYVENAYGIKGAK